MKRRWPWECESHNNSSASSARAAPQRGWQQCFKPPPKGPTRRGIGHCFLPSPSFRTENHHRQPHPPRPACNKVPVSYDACTTTCKTGRRLLTCHGAPVQVHKTHNRQAGAAAQVAGWLCYRHRQRPVLFRNKRYPINYGLYCCLLPASHQYWDEYPIGRCTPVPQLNIAARTEHELLFASRERKAFFVFSYQTAEQKMQASFIRCYSSTPTKRK